jgi:hypothetical protein
VLSCIAKLVLLAAKGKGENDQGEGNWEKRLAKVSKQLQFNH